MNFITEYKWRQLISDYLIEVDAVRCYIETIIGESLPTIVEFHRELENGVHIAKLVMKLEKGKESCCFWEIFDPTLEIYEKHGLQKKHVQNIQKFLRYLKKIGIPADFHPTISDLYERKNIPLLIYCLRAIMYWELHPEHTDIHPFPDFTVKQIIEELSCSDRSLYKFKEWDIKLLAWKKNRHTQVVIHTVLESIISCEADQFLHYFHIFQSLNVCQYPKGEEAARLCYEEFSMIYGFLLKCSAENETPSIALIEQVLFVGSLMYRINVALRIDDFWEFINLLHDHSKEPGFKEVFIPNKILFYYETSQKLLQKKQSLDIFNKLLTRIEMLNIMKNVNEIN